MNPYFADSTFKRVEIQAADYLAYPMINYRDIEYGIYNSNLDVIAVANNDYDVIDFKIDKSYDTILLPRSYYLGYQLINLDNGQYIDTYSDEKTNLVAANINHQVGNYRLIYQRTIIQIISYIISFISLILTLVFYYKEKSHGQNINSRR